MPHTEMETTTSAVTRQASPLAVSGAATRQARVVVDRTWSLWPAFRPLLSWVVDTGADVAALFLAWHLAGWLRLAMGGLLTPITPDQLARVRPSFALVFVLWAVARFAVRNQRSTNPVFGARVDAFLAVSILMVLLAFVGRDSGLTFSRAFVLIFGPLAYVALVIFGATAEGLMRSLHRGLAPVEPCVVVGLPETLKGLIGRILRGSEAELAKLRPVGVVVPPGCSSAPEIHGLPILGTTQELAAIINREAVERVILHDSLPAAEYLHCKSVATRMGVVLTRVIGPDGLESGIRWDLERRYGMMVLSGRSVELAEWQHVVKRALDLVVATAVLVLLGPVMLLIAAAVKLTSPGPCLYVAPRVGRGGRYFSFLKFRTMYTDQCRRDHVKQKNEKQGHIFKIKDDPRVTPLGRFLRRYSLDELPQLINVIRGDMSLVGPRPLPAEDLDPDGMSRTFRQWAEIRSKVRPGITGLWQVRGRSELSFEQMVELDIEYVQNWSLWRDLEILLVTPLVVLSGRGAY